MAKFKNLLWGMLAMLTTILMVGCGEKDNPSRTSLEVDTSDLVLLIGESATRTATSKAGDAVITYSSSDPAVATVDQNGKVTGVSAGNATITVSMDESRSSWYAANSLTYKVIVQKAVSAVALKNADKSTPLTLVADEDGKITVYFNGGITLANDIKYTVNGGTEQTIAKNTEGSYDIVLKKGDMVQLYSNNTSLGGGSVAGARGYTRAVAEGSKHINIRPSMKTEIFGNVMSLLKGKDNLESATAIESPNAFYGLFSGADKLVNSDDRELVLPATTLKEGCYDNMFSGCKGIEKAPELPAPTLVKDCYSGMFSGCSKLSEVKCLATDVSADGCVKDWLADAGKEAETPPVIEVTKEAQSALKESIPATFTTNIAVTKITLEPTALKLMAGETATLKATIEPEDATNKELQWSSSNLRVATVSPDGLSESLEAVVTAVSAGTATITVCTPDGSVKATCQLTVEAKPEVVPSYYKVWVYGEDPNKEPPFQPEALNSAAMRFSSSEGIYFRTLTDDEYFGLKTLIIDVSDATDGCEMRVMNGWWSATYADNIPVRDGQMEVQITEQIAKDCAHGDGGGGKDLVLMLLKGSCTINSVYYEEEGELVLAESLWVQPTASTFYDSGSTIRNSVKIEADIMPKNTKKSLKWTTNNPDILEGGKDGVFIIKGVGVATVTATTTDGSNLSGNCVVTVKPLGGIFYPPIYYGEIITIQKTPGSSPFIQPLRIAGNITNITYTSSDESIATVNASTGEVTISSDAPVGRSVTIKATATLPEEDEYIYPEWSLTSQYSIIIVAPTGQGERDDYGPGTW